MKVTAVEGQRAWYKQVLYSCTAEGLYALQREVKGPLLLSCAHAIREAAAAAKRDLAAMQVQRMKLEVCAISYLSFCSLCCGACVALMPGRGSR